MRLQLIKNGLFCGRPNSKYKKEAVARDRYTCRAMKKELSGVMIGKGGGKLENDFGKR
jgi:hypothetical protein